MFGLTSQEELAISGGPKRQAMALQILQHVASCDRGATCDECETVLDIPHQSASARYFELVHAGLLVETGKRRTKAGSQALVHKVAPRADFKSYLVAAGQKRKARPGLTETEQDVLAAGMEFLSRWKRAKTKKGRVEASVTLVNKLGDIAQRTPKSV